MATKKISEGVGKKIVEALKKQSEIEIMPMAEEESFNEEESLITEDVQLHEEFEEEELHEDFLNDLPSDDDLAKLSGSEISMEMPETPVFMEDTVVAQPQQPFMTQNFAQTESITKELDTFEMPSNIAVLKKLITQLPNGVTRHTGAQIIKQTMEALGISMKSVLQEAQQVQEGLSNSAKECHATIQEYKKQIAVLEKQAQNNQRQYSALNELISLFIQAGV